MSGAACHDLNAAESVVARLEAAGATLLAMRLRAAGPAGVRSSMPEPVREACESYGWVPEPIRAAIPDAEAITAMDEAFGWLALIPPHRRVLRRIVAARSLVHPLSGRHCMTWRRVGDVVGASHTAVRVWHAQGIACIVLGLGGGHG